MTNEGPVLDRLTHRLSECPGEFLDEPCIGKSGKIRVAAVVNDSIMNLGGDPVNATTLHTFYSNSSGDRNRLRLTLIACWLLNDPWFTQKRCHSVSAMKWLQSGFGALAALLDAVMFVTDADRREELARLCLAALDLRPAGETENQASDRMMTLDSVERSKIIRDTQEKQKRARALREQMRKKEAEEAAAKVTRE